MKKLIVLILFTMIVTLCYASIYSFNVTDNMTGFISTRIVYSGEDSWDAAHDTTEGDNSSDVASYVGSFYDSPYCGFYRQIVRINTASLDDDLTPQTIQYSVVILNDATTSDFYLKIVEASDTLTSSVFGNAIYSGIKGWNLGDISGATVLSDSISTAGISNGDTLTFTFNTNGKTIINKTGVTQFWILSNRDIWKTYISNNSYVRLADDSSYMTVIYEQNTRNQIYNIDTTPIYNIDTIPMWKK